MSSVNIINRIRDSKTNICRLALVLGWFIVLIAIPLVSYIGRQAQYFVMEYLNRSNIGVMLLIVTLILTFTVGTWLIRRRGWQSIVHIIWMVSAISVIFYTLPPGERWLHVPLFGLFAFLSVRLYGFSWGLAVALSLSGLDELWQHFLPDRFGSPLDATINAISSIMGAVIAAIGDKEKQPAECETINHE